MLFVYKKKLIHNAFIQVPEWANENCTNLNLVDTECDVYRKHISIPYNTTDNDDIVYAQCKKYDVANITFAKMVDIDDHENGTVNALDVIKCDEGWEHDRPKSEYTVTQEVFSTSI